MFAAIRAFFSKWFSRLRAFAMLAGAWGVLFSVITIIGFKVGFEYDDGLAFGYAQGPGVGRCDTDVWFGGEGGQGGFSGPELTDAGARLQPDFIAAYTVDPQRFDPHVWMPTLTLKDQDVQRLTAYLAQLGQGDKP